MQTTNRRYDIDWIRVIAIGLLLVYHVAIGFQSWGLMIGFITNERSWPTLWIPMSMLNIWRIPLLFFISGMGVYFSMQNKNRLQLLKERTRRILIPFLFGIFCLVPASLFLLQYYYHWPLKYIYNPGHLWFLGNIFVYTVVLLPVFFYLKKNANGRLVMLMKRVAGHPLGLLPVVAVFVAEALLADPKPYELYAMTWHGFYLGLLAFCCGFYFVMNGDVFWKMLLKWRWLFICAAVAFFSYRLLQLQGNAPGWLLAIESNCWVFAVLAFGYRYLNHPGKLLAYLSEAAYPIYIMHMLFLFLGSILIFPLHINVQLQFFLVLLFTLFGCLVTYEYIIKRVKILRLLFGLKIKQQAQ